MTHATPEHRSAAEQTKLEAALTRLYEEEISFNQTLRLKVVDYGTLGPTLRFEMRPELVGHMLYNRLHGGVISAALDVVGSFALMWEIARKHADETAAQVMARFARFGTIDLRVDFLRQGIGQHFIASAQVLRLGGRVGTTQMRLVNDEDTLIATAAAAYMIN